MSSSPLQPATAGTTTATSVRLWDSIDRIDETLLQLLLSSVPLVVNHPNYSTTQSNKHTLLFWGVPLLHLGTLLWSDGTTPATRLLGFFADSKKHYQSSSRKPHKQRYSLLFFAIWTAILPVLYRYAQEWLREQEHRMNDQDNNNSITEQQRTTTPLTRQQRRAYIRRRALIECFVHWTQVLAPFWKLSSLLYLWTLPIENHPTIVYPSLARWITGLAVQPIASPSTSLHVEASYRRWMWEECSRCMQTWFQGYNHLFFFRLPSSSSIRQRLSSILYPHEKKNREDSQTITACPICQCQPILVPVNNQCGHAYCFACLLDADETNCRLCSAAIAQCTFV